MSIIAKATALLAGLQGRLEILTPDVKGDVEKIKTVVDKWVSDVHVSDIGTEVSTIVTKVGDDLEVIGTFASNGENTVSTLVHDVTTNTSNIVDGIVGQVEKAATAVENKATSVIASAAEMAFPGMSAQIAADVAAETKTDASSTVKSMSPSSTIDYDYIASHPNFATSHSSFAVSILEDTVVVLKPEIIWMQSVADKLAISFFLTEAGFDLTKVTAIQTHIFSSITAKNLFAVEHEVVLDPNHPIEYGILNALPDVADTKLEAIQITVGFTVTSSKILPLTDTASA